MHADTRLVLKEGTNWNKISSSTSCNGVMDSQSDKESSTSSGMSFSGFTFQKKAPQSKIKLDAGVSLGGEESRGSRGDVGKDYVLSVEGKAIHRLVGVMALCLL